MSDEPLYCQTCGLEMGCGCVCPGGSSPEPQPPRASRYCEVCGVIPREGGECHFYKAGGNRKGCES